MENNKLSRRCAANFNLSQMDLEDKKEVKPEKELKLSPLEKWWKKRLGGRDKCYELHRKYPSLEEMIRRKAVAGNFKKPSFYSSKTEDEQKLENAISQESASVCDESPQQASATPGSQSNSKLPKVELEVDTEGFKRSDNPSLQRPDTPRPPLCGSELPRRLFARNGSSKVSANSVGQPADAPQRKSGSELTDPHSGGEDCSNRNVPKDDTSINPKKLVGTEAKGVEDRFRPSPCLYNLDRHIDDVLERKSPYRYYKLSGGFTKPEKGPATIVNIII